ncbi:hypothetical protein Trydic_g20084 [Trypoxylus dichotomus]
MENVEINVSGISKVDADDDDNESPSEIELRANWRMGRSQLGGVAENKAPPGRWKQKKRGEEKGEIRTDGRR